MKEIYEKLRGNGPEHGPSFTDHLLSITQGTDGDDFELPDRPRDYTPKSAEG